MLSSSDRFFQTRPCTIMIQNSSKFFFQNSALPRSEKPFHGLVLNNYGTGTRLKKSVGLLEHTLIPHERAAVKNSFSTYVWSKVDSCSCEFLYTFFICHFMKVSIIAPSRGPFLWYKEFVP